MEVLAQYLEDSKFEVAARGHRVICDQPVDNGGSDAGMSPPEFLLASLATCAAYYAAQYLKARKLPAQDLKVRVSAEKATQPARLASFHIEVTVPGLDDRQGRIPESFLDRVSVWTPQTPGSSQRFITALRDDSMIEDAVPEPGTALFLSSGLLLLVLGRISLRLVHPSEARAPQIGRAPVCTPV